MSKKLIIAEKPSVAADIAKALGGFERKSDSTGDWFENNTTLISSAVGHLVEIQCPKDQDPGFDLEKLPALPEKFELVPIEKTAAKLRLLKKLITRSDVSTVINACDAGREGELIFRYIYNYVGTNKNIERMWMQSMTAPSIREAYSKLIPGKNKESLYDASVCRSEADWYIGINSTRGVSCLVQQETGERARETIGRVQTPVLAIVVDREREIKTFVPKAYFEIEGKFRSAGGDYLGKWHNASFVPDEKNPDSKADRLFDAQQAASIVKQCQNVTPSSVKEETTDVSTNPPLLFDLTGLQKECNVKFSFSAKKTLEIAQNLYEKHKVLSYPRTDSTHLPEDYIPTVEKTLGQLAQGALKTSEFAKQILGSVKPNKRVFNNEKISDHFAIIPTGISHDLTSDEERVFDLVTRRFIAAFFPPAKYKQTTRVTIVADHQFKSSGRVLVSSGWKAVYGSEANDKDDPALAKVAQGEIPANIGIKQSAKETKPPSRYTEATLLAAMEGAGKLVDDEETRKAMAEKGLGTPATRAGIIEKLLLDKDKKGKPIPPYAIREGKEIIPMPKAEKLIDFLRQNGLAVLTSPATTGEWEFGLAQIEKGKITRSAFMQSIKQMTHKIIDRIREKSKTLPPRQQAQSKPFDGKCPLCSSGLNDRGKVVSCTSCDFTLWKEMSGKSLSETVLKTLLDKGETDLIKGFISKKTQKPFDAALKLTSEGKVEFVFAEKSSAPTTGGSVIGETCKTCQKGKIVARQNKEGKAFLGCSRYPDCKHFEWYKKGG